MGSPGNGIGGDDPSPAPTQGSLVDDLLAQIGTAARRTYIQRMAGRWQPEAVALLKTRADHLMGIEPRRAIHVARAAHLVAEALGADETLGVALRALAQTIHVLGHYALAVALYERSVTAFEQAGQPGQAGGTRAAQIDALMRLGRYTQAFDLAVETRAQLVALGEQRRVAVLDGNLGNGYLLLDRPGEALEAYTRAHAIYMAIDDQLALARNLVNRGNAAIALNDPQAAIQDFEEAAARFDLREMSAFAGQTRYNLAYVHFMMGRYADALAGLERARDVFTALDDRQYLAQCALDEAEVLLSLGRAEESVTLGERARDSLLRLGMRHEAARAMVLVAQGLNRIEKPDDATASLTQAHEIFAAEANQMRLITIGLTTGAIDLRRGNAAAALRAADEALLFLGEQSRPAFAAEAYLLRARALRLLGRRGQRAAAERALRVAREAGSSWAVWQARHFLGQLRDAAGDRAGAARAYRLAAAEVERMRGAVPLGELRAAFGEDKRDLYVDMVLNALERGQQDEAFSYVERAKSRALVDLLAGSPAFARASTGEDMDLIQRIEVLRGELTWLYNRMQQDDEEQRRLGPLSPDVRDETARREIELDHLTRRLRTRQAEYVSLRTVETVSLTAIRGLLPRSTVLLEYFTAGDDALVFIVSSSGIRVQLFPGVVSLTTALLRRWRLHLGKFAYGQEYVRRQSASLGMTALTILQRLYTLLLAPIELPLEDQAILVVPHGVLHGVPFHALHTGHRYVIEDHAVSYVPSASVLRYCLERPERAEGYTLVVGVPDQRTPALSAEVSTVAGLFNESVVLAGADATTQAFRSLSSGATRVHIASHAVFRADNPTFSALGLADRWLTLHEIYDLNLRADLVTLSGCETGAVAARDGEELIGLIRGFLYAGASALVASMWAVDDAAAATFMAVFYRALLDGQSPRTALRTAQRQSLASQPLPYYWAPFTVIGRPWRP